MPSSIASAHSSTRETLKLTGRELRERLQHEVCIPIQEDYGAYAIWLWFPGRSLSATAHWWVHEVPPQLIGQVYGPADEEAYAIYAELEDDGALPWVFADGDWNTYMVLPARFESNLIPRFARTTVDLDECRGVKRKRLGKNGQDFKRVNDDARLLANWRASESLAQCAIRRLPSKTPAGAARSVTSNSSSIVLLELGSVLCHLKSALARTAQGSGQKTGTRNNGSCAKPVTPRPRQSQRLRRSSMPPWPASTSPA